MSAMPVFFESLTLPQNGQMRVWLRHPFRMLECRLQDLIDCERGRGQGMVPFLAPTDSFSLGTLPFTEYQTLPAYTECKLPIMVEIPRGSIDSFQMPSE